MNIVYLLVGILVAILSALPLGASNIAVINTTIKKNTKQALKIAITAGIAEVILSYSALHYNQPVKNFFNTNLWIQFLIAFILLSVGTFLFFKRQTSESPKKRRLTRSKYALGFILGMMNPPVLIFWVLAINFLNDNYFILSLQSSLSVLVLFFTGVYLGKLLTLYAYSKISMIIRNKIQNITLIINKVTGLLLFSIGCFQAIKLYFI